jgi:hypothetical protein
MSRRPNENEEEYIQRLEMEKQREQVAARRRELAQEEASKLKELHYMKCPKCGSDLSEVEFRGVKVDKCFSCGGVYLDDGELEQLVGRPGWFEAMRDYLR